MIEVRLNLHRFRWLAGLLAIVITILANLCPGTPLRAASRPFRTQADVRAALQARYDRFNRSLRGKNLSALADLCTADCRFQTRPGGPSLSLDQFKREAAHRPLIVRRATTRIDRLTVKGATAQVLATWSGELSTSKSGKSARPVHSVQKLKDIWTKSRGGWRMRSSIVLQTQGGDWRGTRTRAAHAPSIPFLRKLPYLVVRHSARATDRDDGPIIIRDVPFSRLSAL